MGQNTPPPLNTSKEYLPPGLSCLPLGCLVSVGTVDTSFNNVCLGELQRYVNEVRRIEDVLARKEDERR